MDATRLACTSKPNPIARFASSRLGPSHPDPLCGVRGLIIEPTDVLYDESLWRRWLLKLITRMGLHTHYDAFFELWDEEYLAEVHCGHRTQQDALADFLLAAGFSRACIDEVVAAARAQQKRSEHDLRLLPKVNSTLTRLAGDGIRLAISAETDAPASQLASRFSRLGLSQPFKSILTSRDLQQVKPAAVCYQRAAAELGLPLEQVAFVGRRHEHLAGAHALGIPTIALACRHAAEDIPDNAIICHIDRFAQLLDLIRTPAPARKAG